MARDIVDRFMNNVPLLSIVGLCLCLLSCGSSGQQGAGQTHHHDHFVGTWVLIDHNYQRTSTSLTLSATGAFTSHQLTCKELGWPHDDVALHAGSWSVSANGLTLSVSSSTATHHFGALVVRDERLHRLANPKVSGTTSKPASSASSASASLCIKFQLGDPDLLQFATFLRSP